MSHEHKPLDHAAIAALAAKILSATKANTSIFQRIFKLFQGSKK